MGSAARSVLRGALVATLVRDATKELFVEKSDYLTSSFINSFSGTVAKAVA